MRSHRWRQGTALLMRRELTDEVAGEARGAAKRWQHAGENLEPQVLFIAQPVGTTLNDPDLIVEPFDKSKRYLILRLAVGGDAIRRPSSGKSIRTTREHTMMRWNFQMGRWCC